MALVTITKDGIVEQEDADFLMSNVLQILFKKSDTVENAKVGALLLLEAFVKENIFGKEICENFMQDYLQTFTADKSYKIKRPLMQCLITISKHLDSDTVSKQIFPTYKKFSHQQEVWGLRRLCIQSAADMVEHVDASDIDSLKYILDFLAMSLRRPPSSLPQDQVNSEKWVRNQAM